MNLRDYLLLKVEIEGTSGEGSMAVRSFRQVSVTCPGSGTVRGIGPPFGHWQLAQLGVHYCHETSLSVLFKGTDSCGILKRQRPHRNSAVWARSSLTLLDL